MSLKYVLHLTAPERQVLTRIAKGRCGCPRPAMRKVKRARALLKCDAEPEGAGWTDEEIAAALDVSAGSMGRGRYPAVTEGPRPCWSVGPRHRGPANWTARAHRQAERLILVCDRWNTHTYTSFYRAFPPAETAPPGLARQLVFTPRHGSWLHRAPELNVLTR